MTPSYLRLRPDRALVRLLSYGAFEGRPATTRGRWINPLVLAHLRTLARLPGPECVDPVFIVGSGRSGTTVLGVTLSLHRSIAFLNEPKAVWHVVHPEEDVIGNYARTPGRFVLDERDASPHAIRAARRIYGWYRSVTGARVVLDKYPELVFRPAFVRALFPRARFIVITRNGWDTSLSIESWSQRLGREQDGQREDWWGVGERKWQIMTSELVPQEPDLAPHLDSIARIADHRQRAALEWILTTRAGQRLARRFPDAVLNVRFEELTANAPREMGRILEFIGVPADTAVTAFAQEQVQPQPPRGTFDLASGLRHPFMETLELAGYTT